VAEQLARIARGVRLRLRGGVETHGNSGRGEREKKAPVNLRKQPRGRTKHGKQVQATVGRRRGRGLGEVAVAVFDDSVQKSGTTPFVTQMQRNATQRNATQPKHAHTFACRSDRRLVLVASWESGPVRADLSLRRLYLVRVMGYIGARGPHEVKNVAEAEEG
jgi:hypothetical protein